MSYPVDWHGTNKLLTSPKGVTKEQIVNMHIFTNDKVCVSRWQLSPEAVEEIVKTGGLIYAGIYSGSTQPPIFIGSEKEIHEIAVDYGPVWKLK